MKRIWPENRNPEVRLASRRAYRNRNRDKINAHMREKYKTKREKIVTRIQMIDDYSKLPKSNLISLLDTADTPELQRVIRRYISEAKY